MHESTVRMTRVAALLALGALLAACASKPRTEPVAEPPPAPAPEPVQAGTYAPAAAYPAATIAELRAAPPPATPQVAMGANPDADAQRLQAQGYVRIGTGQLPLAPAAAGEAALAQALRSGADQVLLYPLAPSPAVAAAPGGTTLEHYVRFRLPFGARFRDLDAAERARLGVDGGIMLGAIIGDSPASQANLLEGDVVLRINGKPIAGADEFRTRLREQSGRPVTLSVLRNGTVLARSVRLGVAPPPPDR